MTDFSPHAVKAAARRVAARVTADETGDFATLSNGDIETTAFGCIVRVATMLDGEKVYRVIDKDGRHWFPDLD